MNSTQLSSGANRSIALGNTEFDQGPHVSESDQLNVSNQKYLAVSTHKMYFSNVLFIKDCIRRHQKGACLEIVEVG
jgi:hypothetical protein